MIKGHKGSVYKKGRYHPYECQDSKSDNGKQHRRAWKNISRGHNKRSKGKHQYSSRPAIRVNRLINDNQCITLLQEKLLTGSPSVPRKTNFLNVNCHVVNLVLTAPGHSQWKELSPGSAGCYLIQEKLKYVKGASCATQLSCVKPVTNVPIVVTNLPARARL